MKPIPWRYINSWGCIACGLCCRGYDVVLKYPEWVKIIQTYGIGVTRPGIDSFFLGKNVNDSCIFLYEFLGRWLCGLQHMKPRACKLWPFKVHSQPTHGRQNYASYEYRNNEFFIYADPACPGLQYGRNPSDHLVSNIIPEFVEIAIGVRDKQFYSTSGVLPKYPNFTARKVI